MWCGKTGFSGFLNSAERMSYDNDIITMLTSDIGSDITKGDSGSNGVNSRTIDSADGRYAGC